MKIRLLGARDGKYLQFFCPGCLEVHTVQISNGGWWFNGDIEKPELNPSVLITSGHYISGQPQPPDCVICNDPKWPWPCSLCHLFVKDGEIQFLNDCSHGLAGKTVPMLHIR